MNSLRRRKLMIRWSLATTSMVALFWTIWYFVADKVPAATNIEIFTYKLPLDISLWWSVVIGLILPIFIVGMITNSYLNKIFSLWLVLFTVVGFGIVSNLFVIIAGGDIATGFGVGISTSVMSGLTLGLILVVIAMGIKLCSVIDSSIEEFQNWFYG